MQSDRAGFISSLICAILVIGCVGCSKVYKPDANVSRKITPAEARKILSAIQVEHPIHGPLQLIEVSGKSRGKITNVRISGNKNLIIKCEDGFEFTSILKDISIEYKIAEDPLGGIGRDFSNGIIAINGKLLAPFRPDDGRKFADALHVIKKTAFDEDIYQSIFEKTWKSYPPEATKTTLPEEARKYKVQAESAVREKSYDEAADLYREALTIAPWWAEGHFNRALILAEQKDFETAIIEMKRYLRLVPNAPDARAAQDKIYEWERKAIEGKIS